MSVANIPSPSIHSIKTPQSPADITKSPASPRGSVRSDNSISAKHQPTTSPSDDINKNLPNGPIKPDNGNPTKTSESQPNLSSQDNIKLETNVDPFAANYDTVRYLSHVSFDMEDSPVPKIELKIDKLRWRQINTNTVELKVDRCKVEITVDDPRATIMLIFEKTVFNSKTRIGSLNIEAIFPPEFAKYTSIVTANHIEINSLCWMNIFVPKCNSIRLHGYPSAPLYEYTKSYPSTPTVEIPWTPLLSDAKDISVEFPCNINDDQLLSSQWNDVGFDKTNITETGLNLLIKKWINKEYGQLSFRGTYDWRKIVEGLKYKKIVDMDEDIENEWIHVEIKMKHKTGYFLVLYHDGEESWKISIEVKTYHCHLFSSCFDIPSLFHYFYNKDRKKYIKRMKKDRMKRKMKHPQIESEEGDEEEVFTNSP